MVAERGLANWSKRSYPFVKKSFETQHRIIPIDPAILATIGHRFITATKKKKMKTNLFFLHLGVKFSQKGAGWQHFVNHKKHVFSFYFLFFFNVSNFQVYFLKTTGLK